LGSRDVLDHERGYEHEAHTASPGSHDSASPAALDPVAGAGRAGPRPSQPPGRERRAARCEINKGIRARDARAAARPAFVPIHITPAVAAPSLEVALHNGRVVRVPPGFDLVHLRAVVAALEGQTC
jgi:hypothetical protein